MLKLNSYYVNTNDVGHYPKLVLNWLMNAVLSYVKLGQRSGN